MLLHHSNYSYQIFGSLLHNPQKNHIQYQETNLLYTYALLLAAIRCGYVYSIVQPPNPRPGKQRILHVFTAEEGVGQTQHRALRHVGRALYPAKGRMRISCCASATGTPVKLMHYVTVNIIT